MSVTKFWFPFEHHFSKWNTSVNVCSCFTIKKMSEHSQLIHLCKTANFVQKWLLNKCNIQLFSQKKCWHSLRGVTNETCFKEPFTKDFLFQYFRLLGALNNNKGKNIDWKYILKIIQCNIYGGRFTEILLFLQTTFPFT